MRERQRLVEVERQARIRPDKETEPWHQSVEMRVVANSFDAAIGGIKAQRIEAGDRGQRVRHADRAPPSASHFRTSE